MNINVSQKGSEVSSSKKDKKSIKYIVHSIVWSTVFKQAAFFWSMMYTYTWTTHCKICFWEIWSENHLEYCWKKWISPLKTKGICDQIFQNTIILYDFYAEQSLSGKYRIKSYQQT